MTIEHFFLIHPTVPVPERLVQAFPEVRALAGAALQTRMRARSPQQSLVWLSSADGHWRVDLRQILQAEPGARVVLLSSAPDGREGLSALNDGVRGYTHAYAVPALLQEVALVVKHGGLWVGADLLQRLVASTNDALARLPLPAETSAPAAVAVVAPAVDACAALTAREAQVARAVVAGRSNKEVAALLFISERTVKAHLGAVFEKLGVRDRLQLVLRLAASAAPGPASASGPMA